MWTHEEARSEEEVAALRESLVVVGKKTVGSVEEVCLVAEDMRAVFKSGHSLPLSKRKEQLQRLEQGDHCKLFRRPGGELHVAIRPWNFRRSGWSFCALQRHQRG